MAKKILLVDDDKPIRDLYHQLLTQSGYEVVLGTNGQEALDQIKSAKFDLILLDIMMPKIDGIGILDILKEQKIKHAPIVIMTNLISDPILKTTTEKGAIASLIKIKLDPNQFVETINQIIKKIGE